MKFCVAETKPSLIDLFDEVQKEKESLTAYVTTFKERALDCIEVISKKELICICIKGMQVNYKMHIVNHTIPNFSEVMDKAKNAEAIVSEIHKAEVLEKPTKKHKISPLFSRENEKLLWWKKENFFQIPPKISLEKNKILALVKAWIEDGKLRCLPVVRISTQEEIENPKFYIFHKKIGHATPDCYMIKRVCHDKA